MSSPNDVVMIMMMMSADPFPFIEKCHYFAVYCQHHGLPVGQEIKSGVCWGWTYLSLVGPCMDIIYRSHVLISYVGVFLGLIRRTKTHSRTFVCDENLCTYYSLP